LRRIFYANLIKQLGLDIHNHCHLNVFYGKRLVFMTKDRASPMPVMTLAMSQFELLSE